MGKGGAFSVRGSVTPGMSGISGGKERHFPREARETAYKRDDFIPIMSFGKKLYRMLKE